MTKSGKDNPNYKHGRCIENRCESCNTLIDWRSKNCVKCRSILNNSFKGKHHSNKSKAVIGIKSKAKFTEEYKRRIIEQNQGSKHRAINGYILIKNYTHPNRNSHNDILEHILVMSNFIGRPLKKGEIIHHIDFDRKNNDISNLHLYKNRKEHLRESRSLFQLVKALLSLRIIAFDDGEYRMINNGGGD